MAMLAAGVLVQPVPGASSSAAPGLTTPQGAQAGQARAADAGGGAAGPLRGLRELNQAFKVRGARPAAAHSCVGPPPRPRGVRRWSRLPWGVVCGVGLRPVVSINTWVLSLQVAVQCMTWPRHLLERVHPTSFTNHTKQLG